MDFTRRSLALFGVSALGGLALGGRAWADAPNAIRQVTLTPGRDGNVRVALAVDRRPDYRTFFLSSPDRFVIDVAEAQWLLPQGRMGDGPGVGVVTRYRYAPRPDGASRLVLDLASPANLVRRELGSSRAPLLSFDLQPTGASAAVEAQPLQLDGRNTRRVVVVDPGHGGHDPGAIGVTGVREKDVVLDAALQLRTALEARGQYRVALTRDDDTFVPLEQRVRFARAQNADLFISLHADSSPNHDARGATVYTLSEHGAARAQNLMTAQNWDLDMGDAPRNGVVSEILVDLAQRETTNRSAEFAEMVIPRLRAVSPLLVSSHRNAGFFVLLAPDVPAVLIETGFLSNATDERRLADASQRRAVAGAIADAVDSYFQRPQLFAGA